ncbi:hypothetical protein AO826_07510 [Xanthomonas phaseoli pv. manihotis]|nr:hypothetical protein AO826_07510 [Xanthomonas phaseoli pv. manihotis]
MLIERRQHLRCQALQMACSGQPGAGRIRQMDVDSA